MIIGRRLLRRGMGLPLKLRGGGGMGRRRVGVRVCLWILPGSLVWDVSYTRNLDLRARLS